MNVLTYPLTFPLGAVAKDDDGPVDGVYYLTGRLTLKPYLQGGATTRAALDGGVTLRPREPKWRH